MGSVALSRRDFLRMARRSDAGRIRPPGVSCSDLADCTGCGKCVEHCPTGIVALADGRPALDFARGECTFCGACAASCPEPVFSRGAVTRFDHVVAVAASCLALNRVDCQACRDACPAAAIRFRPVRGGPFVPELAADACTGCGACIAVCPAGALAVTEAAHG